MTIRSTGTAGYNYKAGVAYIVGTQQNTWTPLSLLTIPFLPSRWRKGRMERLRNAKPRANEAGLKIEIWLEGISVDSGH